MFVKTIEQIRRENFVCLVAEAGGVTRFAEKMEKSQSQFSQIMHGAPDSKTGKPKEIGSKLARAIEERFQKDVGWMDHEPEDQEYQVFKKLPPEVRAWIMNNAYSHAQQSTGNNVKSSDVNVNERLIQSGPDEIGAEEWRKTRFRRLKTAGMPQIKKISTALTKKPKRVQK